MESKLYMPEHPKKNKTGLLPHSFKKVGIAVMVLAFIPAILVKAIGIAMAQTQKELIRVVTLNVFILGLLFLAWSRDKIEDEMTLVLRLKSMGFAFLWGVLLVVVEPLINVFFKNPIENSRAQGLVISMLLVYLTLYYLQKKGR
jgi:FtsH-binding integral membrane protein